MKLIILFLKNNLPIFSSHLKNDGVRIYVKFTDTNDREQQIT